MVHGINGTGNVNNDIKLELNKVNQPATSNVNSTFGEGYAGSGNTIAITRNIPGLEQVLAKFDFEPPKYNKNIAQLTISDKDYIPDSKFKESAFQEV